MRLHRENDALKEKKSHEKVQMLEEIKATKALQNRLMQETTFKILSRPKKEFKKYISEYNFRP